MSRFYVTTPIYYVNDLPHIGHIYTTVVADAVARFRRLAGDEVYFLTGTDEHGQKIERAALAQGVAPIDLADRVVARYHDLWDEIGISHDDFIRTTEERHRRGVEALIARIAERGDLYVDRHEGWYCTSCETFYTEKELLAGNRCPQHEREAEWQVEDNVFFRLSAYQERLLELYDSRPEFIRPETRRNEVRSFVESGLRDLSVSRADLEWGIPFPGHEGQAVYVWLDALSNYVTALGYGADDGEPYERFWVEGDTRLHLIGKDILRHHAVFWPAFLMSAGLPLPTTVYAHGWWLADDRKISKTASGGPARPDHLVAEFGADPLRFFLLREMSFGQDAAFSDEGFADCYNDDLANDLGNTLSRLVTLSRRAFDGRTPPTPCDDNPLRESAAEVVPAYRAEMADLAFHKALDALWRLLAEANQYLVAREPWRLIKSEGPSERVSRILWNGLEALRIVTVGLLPAMPELAARVLAGLGVDEPPDSLDAMAWGGLPTGALLPEPSPLFPRIDKDEWLAQAAEPTSGGGREVEPGPAEEENDMIDIDRFFETSLKVGTVVACEPIPKADKLLRLEVDLGEDEPRTLVAGIAKDYEPDALVGRQVVVVANLEPATLMGVESQGMVLAASEEGGPVLLAPDRQVPNGTPVR